MKIAVINYSELNKCPSRNEVISDIRRLFINSSTDLQEDMGTVLREELAALSSSHVTSVTNDDCSVVFFDTSSSFKRNNISDFIDELKPDLLVSYNLAGFEMGTLADSLLYNLFNCRQFHIIKKKNLPNEIYLDKLRSLNLFLFEDY